MVNFAARQAELKERLQWAPSRGPKRRAVLDELRALVRDELARELASAGEPHPAASDDEPSAPEEPRLYARQPYWIEQ